MTGSPPGNDRPERPSPGPRDRAGRDAASDDSAGRHAPPHDPAARFTGRVEAYARHRPGYPPAVLDLLREEIGLAPGWQVADLGSGTGLSSELFLAAGHRVHGVEPNPEMRAAAESRLGRNPRFRSVEGRAEATGLPDRSVDLVVAGQAFHWFDPGAARRECARILRGRFAVLLFHTRRTEGPFGAAYEALLRRYGTDYDRVRHDRRLGAALEAFFPSGHERRLLSNEQALDPEGLIGRTRSCSYVPEEGNPDHRPMLDALEVLFERHAEEGVVRMEYELAVYFGSLR